MTEEELALIRRLAAFLLPGTTGDDVAEEALFAASEIAIGALRSKNSEEEAFDAGCNVFLRFDPRGSS
ncbi:MAG: hypothetical protein M3456_14875 [Actinomycetota bacterium]|nr:hypothetical protein [Actinomycetota bacterium]